MPLCAQPHYLMKILPFLAIAMLSAMPVQAADDAWVVPADQTKFHVFVLMGQSNMAGYGEILPEDRQPVPRIVNIPNLPADANWQPAAHPLHNLQKSNNFGLGLPFATHYRDAHPDVTVGLISCAVGGAPISQMNKGSKVYDDAMIKIRRAAAQGTLKGVLWHQGESDTVSDELATGYEAKLHQLIRDIRQDTGIPTLPFVAGDLAEFYGTGKDHNSPARVARIQQVRGALKSLPAKVPHTAFAPSTGAKSPDAHMVHMTRESYILLGQAYFDAWNRITR